MLTTLGALGLACSWGIWALLRPPEGARAAAADQAGMIRERFPTFLINPDWIPAASGDLGVRWTVAETFARLGIVFIAWLVISGGFLRLGRH
ncbi:MAG: hypothetical protein JO317_03295, partial [Verrucomicrobiae bacterium]|nr:hypothetical protein [Verrucomicrobiae bacterium]